MKWFKVHAEIIHDPKIRALAFEDRWHFVAVMALTADGTLDEPAELRDELVSVALGLHGVDLDKAKARLMRLRLIGDDWKPCKWDKRQDSTDPRAAERMRRYRAAITDEKQRVATPERNVTRNVTATLRVEERREKREEELEETSCDASRARKAPRFSPPTAEDVNRYCRETGHHIDAERFIDHYASNGWRVGKVPMKSWQHAVAGWWRRDQEKPTARASPTRTRSIAEDLTDRSWA
jgi:hypothetical protein